MLERGEVSADGVAVALNNLYENPQRRQQLAQAAGFAGMTRKCLYPRGARDMDEVEVVNYDGRWPLLFDQEAERLRAVLDPSLILGLEHFGSTAIPNLSAKPIIDILIAVRSLTEAQASFVEALRHLDYVYWADNPKQDRMFFVKGMPPFGSRRSHHVHVTEPDGEMWQRLAFRDYLRAHPEEAATYQRLKLRLAAEHQTDREAYTDAKSAYIESVMRKAMK